MDVHDEVILTCGQRLPDRIRSLRGEVWAHKTSLTPTLFIEVPVPCQEKVWSRIVC